MSWETVIGLEIHVQLATSSKIFSGASTLYGATPNTQACAVDLGLPGVLPVLNARVVEMAITLGLIAARYNGRWPDKAISGVTLAMISLPEFVAAYFVIFLLTQVIPILQPVSMVFPGMGLFEKLHAVALPVIVLVMVVLAHMMRMTRAAILNVMQSAYIETAELKGLSPMQVIWRHAMPNAVAPIISVVVINLAYLVVGVVVVEVVFSYNALGQYLVDHVAKRDLPVVQAVGIIFAAVYIGLNILADLIGIIANPRLRHPK